MTHTSHLREPEGAYRAMKWALDHYIKPRLLDGQRLILEIKPESRSNKQNRLLHAMLSDIARQVQWAGKHRDVETWKRLLTAAWCRARNEHVEMLPALDGHGVDIVFRRTSQLTRAEFVELVEFVEAWCAHTGVTLRDPNEFIDPDTGEITA